MGLFGGRKKKTEEIRAAKATYYRERYKQLYEQYRKMRPTTLSKEFKLYKQKDLQHRSWFEKLCSVAGKILKVDMGGNTKQKIESALIFAGSTVTPSDVFALSVLTIIAFSIIGIVVVVLGVTPMALLFILMGGIGLAYYFIIYPSIMAKEFRINASSQVVLAVLYMVISMRISPNLERALRFAAANVSGELAWDMRRLLWSIEMGGYTSANAALTDYISKWKQDNSEFAESLRLIRDSQLEPPDRAETMLDESLNIILDGTKTRMKHYAQELNTPVMVIHMMGIIMPVMGSVMAPLAAVFLADMISPWHLIAMYNIALPLFIVWFINTILKKRPSTFSQVDISAHPDVPKKGCFNIGKGSKKYSIPVLPLSILVLFVLAFIPVLFFSSNMQTLIPDKEMGDACNFFGSEVENCSFISMAMSMLITLGISMSLALYFFLTNYQKMGIQSTVEDTEMEFEVALFQFGNRISGGVPTELALENSIQDVKDLKIAGLFSRALMNIRNLGMTFREAFFNEQYGAIHYYPSHLVKNIMYMIIDIAQKGVKYASESMLIISRYLKNIRETQEYLRDILSESVSSMNFQAYMLTPMITGLVVAMAQIIINVLSILGSRLKAMTAGGELGMGEALMDSSILGSGGSSIAPAVFQLIIGTYLIEIIIILAIFITKITHGDNKTMQWYLAGKILIISVIIYFMVALGSSMMFGDLIAQSVQNII
ncbi:MAG: hypothetical protein JW716_01460 [Candidatus Aenigmarchaeota archaeon]|nr:hypothetical protein [Candidatus Aenigmarchaeota archaeon]